MQKLPILMFLLTIFSIGQCEEEPAGIREIEEGCEPVFGYPATIIVAGSGKRQEAFFEKPTD